MNIVKIQDTVMTPEVLEAAGYAVKTNIRYAKENSQYWKVGDRRYDEEPVIEHKDATPEEPECWIVNNTDKYFEEPVIEHKDATPEVLEKWVFVDDVNDRRIEYDHEPVIEYHPTQPEVQEHWIIDGDEEHPVYTEPQITHIPHEDEVLEHWLINGDAENPCYEEPVVTHTPHADEVLEHWLINGDAENPYYEDPVVTHINHEDEVIEKWIINNDTERPYYEEPTVTHINHEGEVLEHWVINGDAENPYYEEPVVTHTPHADEVLEQWLINGDTENPYYEEPVVTHINHEDEVIEKWIINNDTEHPYYEEPTVTHTPHADEVLEHWVINDDTEHPYYEEPVVTHINHEDEVLEYWVINNDTEHPYYEEPVVTHVNHEDEVLEHWVINDDTEHPYYEDPSDLIEHIKYQPRVRYYWTIDGNTQQKFFEDPSQYIIHQKYEPAVDAHWTVNGTGFYEDEPSYVHYNYKPAKPEQWIIDGEDIVYVNPGEPELVNVYNILAPEIVAKFGTKDNKLVGDYDDDPSHWTLVNDLSIVPSTQVMVNVTISPEEYEHITEGTYRMVSTTEPGYTWSEDSPFTDMSVEAFCDTFNSTLRNKYMYAVHWKYLEPLTLPTGNPFDLTEHDDYVSKERNTDETVTLRKRGTSSTNSQQSIFQFENIMDWVDQVTTLNILQNTSIKYNYLNEFTPDDDITIEELKVFRAWLAGILLANTPVVDNWDNPEMLKTMLTYYKQNLNDVTTDILSKFAVHMNEKTLVAGTTTKPVVNLAALGLTSGCGCTGGVAGVGNVATTVCDPLQMYRNAIYNYMVSVFSNIDYWEEQVEICVEMRKYIEGILKVGLPLGSKIIDPLADCTCNTLDSDSQVRYKKMLEALVVALGYIIDGTMAGNKNYVATAFSNWATYLYEYMYWA